MAQLLSRLAQIDTPTICNVIELFGVVPRNFGYVDRRIQAVFPQLPPMVGYAATAAFRSATPPQTGDAYASLERQLEQFADLAGPAVVVFQDLDDPSVAATFGEVMCSAYRAFGSSGLITSGTGRDIEQVKALNYPVFTGGTVCSHGYCHLLHLGLPVHVGGLTISTGDLLHGDVNGITRIPAEIATEIPDVAREFIAAERIMLDYVQGEGPCDITGFTERRQEFTSMIQQLTTRLRRTG
ncbi:MAG: RraA family protein [Pirellulales bacterium]|nr:RraA family protein [Pirellulales bacterium]